MTKFARMAVAALAAGCLEAGTVIHYTFDSGDIGTVFTHGSTVTNAANPGIHDAIVYGLSGQNVNSASTRMPVVTNGVPSNYRINDPVSGVLANSADRALRFPVKNGAYGACLQVPNAAALRPESFTVELTLRMPQGEVETSHWNVLAVQPAIMKCANADAWGLRLVGGTPVVRFTPPQTFTLKTGKTDEYNNASGNVELSSANVSDGRWHHVAFTCTPNASDSSKTDVKIFIDYVQKVTSTLSFRPQFSAEENCPIWIGGNRQTSGLFTGEIGEFRFSDEALTKEQFLRPRLPDYDSDIVVHYDFDTLPWFGKGDVQNVADPSEMNGYFATNHFDDVGTFPCITNDSPFVRMRPSRGAVTSFFSTNCLENAYTNASSRQTNAYLYTEPLKDWFSKTNFTIECFYKSNGRIEQYTPFVWRRGGVNVQFNLGVGPTANRLYGVVCPAGAKAVGDQKTFADTANSADSQWHHAAMVVRQGESVKLYRDWIATPVAQVTLTTNLYPKAVNTDGSVIAIAGGSSRNTFNGRLDEVRITLRALEPHEFICPYKPRGISIRIK